MPDAFMLRWDEVEWLDHGPVRAFEFFDRLVAEAKRHPGKWGKLGPYEARGTDAIIKMMEYDTGLRWEWENIGVHGVGPFYLWFTWPVQDEEEE